MKMATGKRHVVLVFSMLENIFHSALIYGWPSIVYVLKDMGFYSDLCPIVSSENISTTSPLTTELVTLPERTDETGDNPVTCDEQDASLLLIYTIASSLLPCSMILGGILFEKAGTLVARLTFSLSLLLSYLCIAASTPEMPNLLYPGTIVMGMAGILLYITSIEVGNLFPASKSTVIGVMTGCCDASAFVFLLVKIAYDFGVPLNASFFILAGSTVMFLTNTILLPRKHIPWPLPEKYELHGCCSSTSDGAENSSSDEFMESKNGGIDASSDKSAVPEGTNSHGVTNDNYLEHHKNICNYENPGYDWDMEETSETIMTPTDITVGHNPVETVGAVETPRTPEPSEVALEHKTEEAEILPNSESYLAALDKLAEDKRIEDYPTIWVVLKSPLFILMTLWAIVCQGFIFFVIGIMNSWLTWLAEGDMEIVSYYTNVYSLIAISTIIGTPLVGRFIDRKRHRLETLSSSSLDVSERGPYTDLKESWLPVWLSCIITILMAGLMLIPVLPVLYATFTIFVAVRSMFYATAAAIVPIMFPMHFYPSVFGFGNFIAGVFSFLQFPFFILIQNVLDDDPRWVIAGLLIANAAMLVLPAYIYIHGRNREKMYLTNIREAELEEKKQTERNSAENQKVVNGVHSL